MLNLFDLFVKIKADDSDFSKGLDGARSKAESFGGKVAKAGKIAAAGLTASAAGLSYLVKQSVEAYASYEQLVGGVDKLFGEASKKVQEYANEAYMSMGLNANQYMEQVTSFSASLISVMGDQEAAADRANLAMEVMADNVSIFGSDMQSVQNAFQGFAKDNYMMLDNLKLGYGGTRSEMERLLQDAASMTKEQEELGLTVDATNMSFDNQIAAIAVIQKHMGIAGNAEAEAMKTIEGSLRATKAAWDNLLLGLANDEADFGKLIDNFVEVATHAFENLKPRIERALVGVVQMIEKFLPVALDMVIELLPDLIDSAATALLSLADALVAAFPKIADTAIQVLVMLMKTIAEALPELLPKVIQVLTDTLIELTQPENMNALIDGAINIIIALTEGITQSAPIIAEAIPVIITNLVSAIVAAFPQLVKAGLDLMGAMYSGMFQVVGKIVGIIPTVIKQIGKALASGASEMVNAGINLMRGLGRGIREGIRDVINDAKESAYGLLNTFTSIFRIGSPSKIMEQYGRFIDEGLAKGIKSNAVLAKNEMIKLGNVASGSFAGSYNSLSGGYEFSVPRGSVAGNGDMTIILELDKTQLAKAVYRLNNEETQRVGLRLSGAY